MLTDTVKPSLGWRWLLAVTVMAVVAAAADRHLSHDWAVTTAALAGWFCCAWWVRGL